MTAHLSDVLCLHPEQGRHVQAVASVELTSQDVVVCFLEQGVHLVQIMHMEKIYFMRHILRVEVIEHSVVEVLLEHRRH